MRASYSKCVAEFLGSFAIVFFGCGFAISAKGDMLAFVPLVFGAIVTIMIYSLGHISGAHLNPAVSVAFALVARFPWRQVPIYILSQLFGALCAAWVLFQVMPEPGQLAVTIPSVPNLNAFILEALLSFFLMFVIISVATDSRAVGMMAGLAIGAIVAVDAFVGGGLTGASMNPARSFGPAIIAGEYNSLWIYLTAPFLGCSLASFCYEWIRCETSDSVEKIKAKGCC